MSHKNWDNVRDIRLYAYLNQKEMDKFLEAMRLQDMDQPATATRTFVIENSDRIIADHRSKQFKQPQVHVQTVKYKFPGGKFTVT